MSKSGFFVTMPIRALLDTSLSHAEYRALGVICSYINNTNQCWPSYQTLATKASLSKRVMMEHIKNLKAKGYIEIQERKGNDGRNHSNVYSVIFDNGDRSPIDEIPIPDDSDEHEHPPSDMLEPYSDDHQHPYNADHHHPNYSNITTSLSYDREGVFDQNASTPENSLKNSVDENKNSNLDEIEVNNEVKLINSNNKDDCCIIYTMENNDLHLESVEQNLSKINTISNKKTITKKTAPKASINKSKKGTMLPEDWELPEDYRNWAFEAAEWMSEIVNTIGDLKIRRVDEIADEFYIYHYGKNQKTNWFSTWQTWCRNAGKYDKKRVKTRIELRAEAKLAKLTPKPIPTETPIPEEFQDSWVKVRECLKSRLGEVTFRSWIAELMPKAIEQDCLIIEAPSRFVIDSIHQRYFKQIRDVCKLMMHLDDIYLVVKNSDREPQYNRSQSYSDDRGVASLVF